MDMDIVYMYIIVISRFPILRPDSVYVRILLFCIIFQIHSGYVTIPRVPLKYDAAE